MAKRIQSWEVSNAFWERVNPIIPPWMDRFRKLMVRYEKRTCCRFFVFKPICVHLCESVAE